MSIYSVDYEKYKNIDYSKCCKLESEFFRQFHTDSIIMKKKFQLEKMVRKYKLNSPLTNHFRTAYKFRKQDFYRKIVYEIVTEDNPRANEILEITKDILFIYSKKQEEKEYLDYLLNHLEAEESHRQAYRESMIEDFRNCD